MLYTIMVTEKQIKSQFHKVSAATKDEAIALVGDLTAPPESEYTSIRSRRVEVVNETKENES